MAVVAVWVPACGDSLYQSQSSFAGSALLISPDSLIEDEFPKPSDCAVSSFSATLVDFDAVKRFKYVLLETAWKEFATRADLRPAFESFGQEQAHWLDDHALFRALKTRYDGVFYLDWPEEIVRRTPAALERARRDVANQIEQVRFAQFLLFRQGERLKAHARARGVRLSRSSFRRTRATCGPILSCSCSARSIGRASSPGCHATASTR